MPSTTELPLTDGELEGSGKTLKTLLSTGLSIKGKENIDEKKSLNPSNQGVDIVEEIKSLKSSIKSEQGKEKVEGNKSPRPSIKSEQGEEKVEGNKSPRPSIKSEQGEEKVEENKSPRPSIKSEQGEIKVEENKSPRPSIKKEQDVENDEATKLLEPSAVENALPQQLLAPLTDVPETVPENVQKALEQEEKPRSKIVSLEDVDSIPSAKDAPSQVVLQSNKNVRQPSIKELDPSVLTNIHTKVNPSPAISLGLSRSEMWLYAVIGIFLLTIVMRFFMTNFKFICVLVYSALVALLALRFVGHGPFASRRQR